MRGGLRGRGAPGLEGEGQAGARREVGAGELGWGAEGANLRSEAAHFARRAAWPPPAVERGHEPPPWRGRAGWRVPGATRARGKRVPGANGDARGPESGVGAVKWVDRTYLSAFNQPGSGPTCRAQAAKGTLANCRAAARASDDSFRAGYKRFGGT